MRFSPFSLVALAACCLIATATATPNLPNYAIAPSKDGRFFVDSAGEPFFWQADTSWALFHRFNLSEIEMYLDDRAAKGYTMILAVGLIQFGITDPNRQGDLPLINSDVTKPNEPYWAHVDTVVEMAYKKGIRIALVPAWGNVPDVINATTARSFGTWIGKRYPGLPKLLVADTNSHWTNKSAVSSNYAAGGVQPDYVFTDYGKVYDELAAGLIAGEGHAAMITTHPTNQWFEGAPLALASAEFGDRAWLTFDSSQSGHSSYAPNPPILWWNCLRGYEPVEIMYRKHKTRPVLDNEPHYEGRYNNGKPVNPYWNASDVRIGSYQAVFSGAAGLTYGADNVMQGYIPGLYENANSGPAHSWAEDIHLPGAGQMQHIKKVIMDRKGYFSRIPDQSIIVSDTGENEKHIVATRDSKGDFIMVYSPYGAAFTLETKSLRKCSVAASWYDPLQGTYQRFRYNYSAGKMQSFQPPVVNTHQDWVLVLECS